MTRTPEQTAQLKANENTIRFEAWCVLMGVEITEESRLAARQAAREWYVINPGKWDVPSEVLKQVALKGANVNDHEVHSEGSHSLEEKFQASYSEEWPDADNLVEGLPDLGERRDEANESTTN